MGFNVFDAIAGAAVGFLEGGPVGAAVVGIADGVTGTDPLKGLDSMFSGGGAGPLSLMNLTQLAGLNSTSGSTGSGEIATTADLSALTDAFAD